MISIPFELFLLCALLYLPLKCRRGGGFHVCSDLHICGMQMAAKVAATRRLNAAFKLGVLASSQ